MSDKDAKDSPQEEIPRMEEPSSRTRVITEKGKQLYAVNYETFHKTFQENWATVDFFTKNIHFEELGILVLRKTEKHLQQLYDSYKKSADEFLSFLQRARHTENENEISIQESTHEERTSKIKDIFKALDSKIQEQLETVSSSKRSHSHKSSTSSVSVLARKEAKAQGTRAKMQFVIEENKLRKQQALLEANTQKKKADLAADMDLLKIQGELAMAEAEVSALHMSNASNSGSQTRERPLPLPVDNPLQRTKGFIMEHSFHTNSSNVRGKQPVEQYEAPPPTLYATYNEPFPNTKLNPFVEEFVPTQQQQQQGATARPIMEDYNTGSHVSLEISRFLLKKELLVSRLVNFTEQPEAYASWKAGFISVVQDLHVSPTEELDLLVKWLGPESSRHAISLRSSNFTNPSKGLERIWQRLDERYGSPEIVEAALRNKLEKFPKLTNKDYKKLFEISDIASEIEFIKEDVKYTNILAYFDSSSGVRLIVDKLPYSVMEQWTKEAIRYKKRHCVPFPPFSFFAEFLREASKDRNDPSFTRETIITCSPKQTNNQKFKVSSKKTEVVDHDKSTFKKCPLHKTNHSLNQCKTFRSKTLRERRDLIRQYGFCFKCCASSSHLAQYCKEVIKCDLCDSHDHPTALHRTPRPVEPTHGQSYSTHGGEGDKKVSSCTVESLCTQICGNGFRGKSCAKTVLVNVYRKDHPENTIRTYAILDDQSNASLGKTELFDSLDINSVRFPYSLSSCSGTTNITGRKTSDLVVESLDGNTSLTLQTLIECNDIPNVRDEIPTPQVAQSFTHLQDISKFIPPLDVNVDILLLIGRDLIEAHHVHEQRIGTKHTPLGQKLPLGWVIIGEACLGGFHTPEKLNVKKTSILLNGRPSILEPCPNIFNIKTKPLESVNPYTTKNFDLGATVFQRTQDDDKLGPSREDIEFLNTMESMSRNSNGNWIGPLPFRTNRQRLPNNRNHALKRAFTLRASLLKNQEKKEHFVNFMQRMLDNGHAELAPPLKAQEECWYLPIFGVYHPQKKKDIRIVFDSSAKFEGVSLNSVLLTGPDLINNLLGILLRFRKEQVAVNVDIEQMFYAFYVQEDQRNFLRFLWHQGNDPSKPLTEYRMCVHVFGNSPSQAIATYGLRKAAQLGEEAFGSDTKRFVERDFYVDDGVTSLSTPEQAIDLLERTRKSLLINGNLKLHKIASNDVKVMSAFPAEELAKPLRELNLSSDMLPMQRSLGLYWDLDCDTFTFKVSSEEKPFTRRGILSTVNSLFDPLGFASPITIQGKLLLRSLISNTIDWDEPLPPEREVDWNKWKDTVKLLEELNIPRPYSTSGFGDPSDREVYVFSDASEKAIAASAYLRTPHVTGNSEFSFILGKAKVSPLNAHTIPRLELCAAVLAVEISDTIVEQLGIDHDQVRYYTDSKIILGYIYNESRRFNVFVTNRISRIRRSSKPDQWSFVSTDSNPADPATRPINSGALPNSLWLQGPNHDDKLDIDTEKFPLVNPALDDAVKPITTLSTTIHTGFNIGTFRFERFSSWKCLVRAITNLIHICNSFQKGSECTGWHMSSVCRNVKLKEKAERQILLAVQHEVYSQELEALANNQPLHKNSPLLSLNPFLDEDGLLRVGGRLRKATMDYSAKHPIIVPGRHYVAILLVRHHHEAVLHQGRHFTEGAVRAAGLWIIGWKRSISSMIHKCVKCRKLRGRQETPLMADLPSRRLEPSPPFSYVGVDAFGPWSVVTRKTRGGQAQAKRWAILFTCLSTRAIHLEVVEAMSSSCFINALRRFISIRGRVVEFRSDRRTNFIGATDDLKIDAVNVESGDAKDFLYNQGTTWIFNPPHSSHMGGVWERLVGVTRRILDSMLSGASGKILTHEVLTTFLAEASAIVNARPIVPISSDAEAPEILSPAALLTFKTSQVTEALGNWETNDLYRIQWKRVQALADTFWKRWRGEYLTTLQRRRKWQVDQRNITQGDIVLLKEKNIRRNEWPVGYVVRPLPGCDDRVRKAEVRIAHDGRTSVYTRPVADMVVLVPS